MQWARKKPGTDWPAFLSMQPDLAHTFRFSGDFHGNPTHGGGGEYNFIKSNFMGFQLAACLRRPLVPMQ